MTVNRSRQKNQARRQRYRGDFWRGMTWRVTRVAGLGAIALFSGYLVTQALGR